MSVAHIYIRKYTYKYIFGTRFHSIFFEQQHMKNGVQKRRRRWRLLNSRIFMKWFRLYVELNVLGENQSFWTGTPKSLQSDTQNMVRFTYSFRFSTVSFAPSTNRMNKKQTRQKRGQTQTTHRYYTHNREIDTHTHTRLQITATTKTKHTKLIFPFICTHKRFHILRCSCNTLLICIKCTVQLYKVMQWARWPILINWNEKFWRIFSNVKQRNSLILPKR